MTTIPFRQPVFPNDKGSDVLAYHRALRKMGYNKVLLSRTAGPQFVNAIKAVQKKNGLKVDGIIGQSTHLKLVKYIDRWGAYLIKNSKLRNHATADTAQAYAQRLLTLHAQGKWRDDNGGGYEQIRRTANGEAVYSRCGSYVHLDKRTLKTIVWLIDTKGYTIGTYAWCSDHSCDGWRGHGGGHAVDISSINGVSIASNTALARLYTYSVARLLYYTPAYRPWQLICDGYGNQHYGPISALCIPYASFFGWKTLSEHRNHIHVGY